MVVEFKATRADNAVHIINAVNVEYLLGRRPPWFRQGKYRDDDAHFAVCPYCDNPIQLKALYRKSEQSPAPYGSHVGKPITGFAFDPERVDICPYQLHNRSLKKSDRRQPSKLGQELIELALAQFDRIIHVLAADLGFWPSRGLSIRMLESWLTSEGFDYVGAHRRNLPWMIAYFSKSEPLFGQRVRTNSTLSKQIEKLVPWSKIDESGRLSKGTSFYQISFQFLHHKTELLSNKKLKETLRFRVQDFSHTNLPQKAPTLLDETIIVDAPRFETLIQLPDDHPKRDLALVAQAKNAASHLGYKYGG